MNDFTIDYESLPDWAKLLNDKAGIPHSFSWDELDPDKQEWVSLIIELLDAERRGAIHPIINEAGRVVIR